MQPLCNSCPRHSYNWCARVYNCEADSIILALCCSRLPQTRLKSINRILIPGGFLLLEQRRKTTIGDNNSIIASWASRQITNANTNSCKRGCICSCSRKCERTPNIKTATATSGYFLLFFPSPSSPLLPFHLPFSTILPLTSLQYEGKNKIAPILRMIYGVCAKY